MQDDTKNSKNGLNRQGRNSLTAGNQNIRINSERERERERLDNTINVMAFTTRT